MTRTIVSASGAAKKMAERKTTIFDLRSFRECCQTGIAKGLATVTIHDTDGIKAFICDMVKIACGNKSKPVALICAAGVWSARALKILAANGFILVPCLGCRRSNDLFGDEGLKLYGISAASRRLID